MKKTKESLYDFICLNVESDIISGFKEIPYGLQFYIEKSLVRIYESKKKGITLDLSQSSNTDLNEKLNNMYEKFQGNDLHSSDFNITDKPLDYQILAPPVAGSDEVGKGDFFAPLVIGAVYLTKEEYAILKAEGVKDSKDLSDDRICKLAKAIKSVTSNYEILVIPHKKYNEMYEKTNNINEILVLAHVHNLRKLHEKCGYKNVIIDRFGREKEIKAGLKDLQLNIKVEPKAEKNIAVAAASILARARLIEYMNKMSEYYKFDFPLGASSMVIKKGREFIDRYGIDQLKNVSKIHFKTYRDIIG